MATDDLEQRSGGRFPWRAPSERHCPPTAPADQAPLRRRTHVRVREWHPLGHTRAPRYVQGKRGPSARRRRGQRPRRRGARRRIRADPTYSVRFESHDLWGEGRPAIPCTSICGSATSRRSMMSDDHHHAAELAPIEARVEALEALLVEKGIFDTAAVDAIVEHYEDSRTDERREGRCAGMDGSRLQGAAARRRRPRRSASSASAGRRASTWSSSRTRPTSTTSWSARCAPATRGRCSGCRRSGTRSRPIAPAGARATRAARGDGDRSARRRRDPRVGLHGRGPLLVLPMRPDGTDGCRRSSSPSSSPATR